MWEKIQTISHFTTSDRKLGGARERGYSILYTGNEASTTKDTCHWMSKVGEHCSFLPHHSGPATRDFQSSLGWSASLGGCAGPPSPTASVLCHVPALWSPPSGSGRGFPMHVPLQLTSPSYPCHRHLGVPSVLSQVSVGSPSIALISMSNWYVTKRGKISIFWLLSFLLFLFLSSFLSFFLSVFVFSQTRTKAPDYNKQK